jgi:hypothetical protein
MTQERMNEIAEDLENKAEAIEQGEYGAEDHGGDDERWCVDLRSAAKKLRANVLSDFTNSELEEIEYSSDADASEIDELYSSEEA